ncbi:class I SAM-dependent methyltransferase [Clostridium algidicarnis]|uniref:class I SAM-dependent methyltransferase n=1 Tax=Clostridium algidicarnis TaxID=37659 RepID=UPI001CF50EB6|nr:class I SAM-dependent methyltransferase [Clostridium algidicarnis]MCB2287484.1 class I SAM-dependent methyltransferase [Clostridium algidicarnis]
MSTMDKIENVKQQYSNDKNLSVRTKLHLKHSTNKQGFVPWLFDKYEFPENCRILELGCGNGGQWQDQIENLPKCCSLTLSDFSKGMVDIVRTNYSKYNNISFQQIDIQNVTFPDETFDIIIANHMLYHIPDLSKALSEVKRVLKTDGKFYSTTNGNGGMRPFLHNSLKHFNPDGDTKAFTQELSFNLQNGYKILNGYFSAVKRMDFEDSLSITETQDLVDWIKSTISIASYSEKDLDGLFDYFEDIRKEYGAINIEKECGLFISIK